MGTSVCQHRSTRTHTQHEGNLCPRRLYGCDLHSPLHPQQATPLPLLTPMSPQSTPTPTEFKTITLRPTLVRVKTATVTLLPAPTLSIFPTVVFRRFPGP